MCRVPRRALAFEMNAFSLVFSVTCLSLVHDVLAQNCYPNCPQLTPDILPDGSADTGGNTMISAVVIGSYVLATPAGIHGFNPFLTDEEAINSASLSGNECLERPFYSTCADTPAIASGLSLLGQNENKTLQFLGITDRGPNQDCGDCFDNQADPTLVGNATVNFNSGKGFPVPRFSPTFGIIQMGINSTATVTESCYLKDTLMQPVTGISTNPNDDTPRTAWCEADLEFDPNGQDSEDIHMIPGTNYAMIVDEYLPSVSVVNADFTSERCGEILVRYIPSGMQTAVVNATYPVKAILPASLSGRRANRGFEALAVIQNKAIVMLQSAMDVDSSRSGRESEIIPAIVLNITDPLHATYLGTKYYAGDSAANGYWVSPRTSQRDIKVSAASWASQFLTEVGLEEEKEYVFMLERAQAQVKIYLVDFESATLTDESAISAANATLIMDPWDLECGNGIHTARKSLVFDSSTTVNFTFSDKMEGFAFLNSNVLLLGDDNDFGLEGNGATSFVLVQLAESVLNKFDQFSVKPSCHIHLKRLGGISGIKAETETVDPVREIALVGGGSEFVLLNYSNPSSLGLLKTVQIVGGGDLNDMQQCNGYAFLAISGPKQISNGYLCHISMEELIMGNTEQLNVYGNHCTELMGAVLPDMLVLTENCSTVVLAIEGEPLQPDPDTEDLFDASLYETAEGGVYIVALDWTEGVPEIASRKFLNLTHLNDMADDYVARGVRWVSKRFAAIDPEKFSFSKDLQPEYVTILPGQQEALVVCQENNAILHVDLVRQEILELYPLPYKQWDGFDLDASDRDGMINLKRYPIWGMPQPDAIESFLHNGEVYFAVAGEGDSWEFEEFRGKDYASAGLNVSNMSNATISMLENNSQLGRIKFSIAPPGHDGESFQELYAFGSRSWSICLLNSTGVHLVYDSGSDLEEAHAEQPFRNTFNIDAEPEKGQDTPHDQYDKRSDDKGPEPETVKIHMIDGIRMLFLSNERTSTMMIYDIDDPTMPEPVYMKRLSPVSGSMSKAWDSIIADGALGVSDPESFTVLHEAKLLLVAGSYSETFEVYKIVTYSGDDTGSPPPNGDSPPLPGDDIQPPMPQGPPSPPSGSSPPSSDSPMPPEEETTPPPDDVSSPNTAPVFILNRIYFVGIIACNVLLGQL